MTANPAKLISVYTGAIVMAPDERILCQLRDNKPGIQFPGFWTCSPGGHVESGELPHEAIVRELKEEFEIAVDQLKPLMTHHEPGGDHPGVYHAFTALLRTPVDQVQCNEGQRADFFHPVEIQKLPMHPISLIFLNNYLETIQNK